MTAIRVGIVVLVAFSVSAHGGVETWSESVLEIGAAALFVLWGFHVLRQRQVKIRWNVLYLPMLGFGGLVVAQWLFGLSVYPFLTGIELLKLAAYFIIFFLAVQSFRTTEECRPFVWFLLVFGFAVALFGIIQFFSFNGKLYWFRELRYGGSPFGPYVNHNHFAGLMELIIPLGLAILFLRSLERDKLALVRLFTLIAIGALFLSASRGGILSFLFQVGLLGVLIWGCRAGKKWLAVATGVMLLAGAFVVWLGVGHALERFARLWSEDLSHNRRVVMVKDSWEIFFDHPWVGTGTGTLVAIYPHYANFYDGRVVKHVHNDYLEMMAEGGLMGALFSLAFVVLLFRYALSALLVDKNPFLLSVRVGALAACSGLLLHSLVDFNFHIPANALLFFLMAFLASFEDGSRKLAI